MVMRTKYYFFVFLFFCCSCKKGTGVQPPPAGNNNSGDGSTTADAVKPFNGTLPAAVFTDPRLVVQNKHSRSIILYLGSLINATPKGAAIYMSVFLFKSEPGLITAIRNAVSRGVMVHVMFDRSHSDYNDPTVEKLTSISKNIDVVSFYNNISSSAINHNKFALFSALSTTGGDIKNVVFTSSENWTPGTEQKIQNAIILSGEGLYDAFLQYWKDMKSHADHDMASYNYREYDDLKDGIQAFFYPKRKNGSYFAPDPIVHILDQITDPSSTTIQIAMAFWHDRAGITNKLGALMSRGAKVEIVVRSGQPAGKAIESLAKNGAFVKMYNYTNVPGVKEIQLHSKEMIIQGEWNGHKTNVIITGSENYNYGGLMTSANNDVLLSSYRFKHPEIFKAFEDNFNAMKILPGVCCTTSH